MSSDEEMENLGSELGSHGIDYDQILTITAVVVLNELIHRLLTKEPLTDKESQVFQQVCEIYGLG